jgi:hypothetical protein
MFSAQEHVSLNGVESTSGKTITSKLYISLINPSIPADSTSTQLRIGKSIAQLCKFYLKDTSSFNFYEVRYVRQRQSGASTIETYRGYQFDSHKLDLNDVHN